MENENVVVDGWNQQYMIPAMLKLIQEQHKQYGLVRLIFSYQ